MRSPRAASPRCHPSNFYTRCKNLPSSACIKWNLLSIRSGLYSSTCPLQRESRFGSRRYSSHS